VIIDEVGEADEDGDVGATGRSQADAPEIERQVFLRDVPAALKAGDFVQVEVEDAGRARPLRGDRLSEIRP
jgi:ribosomal protein S12 methylthiotransferase